MTDGVVGATCGVDAGLGVDGVCCEGGVDTVCRKSFSTNDLSFLSPACPAPSSFRALAAFKLVYDGLLAPVGPRPGMGKRLEGPPEAPPPLGIPVPRGVAILVGVADIPALVSLLEVVEEALDEGRDSSSSKTTICVCRTNMPK